MTVFIFLLVYLIPLFLIHLIGYLLWKKTDKDLYGTTFLDMYNSYISEDLGVVVFLAWAPLLNVFVLILGLIVLIVNLLSTLKLR